MMTSGFIIASGTHSSQHSRTRQGDAGDRQTDPLERTAPALALRAFSQRGGGFPTGRHGSIGLSFGSPMKSSLNRRAFLKQTTVLGAGLATVGSPPSPRAAGANNKVVVTDRGTNGGGWDHIGPSLAQPAVEMGYISDVDSRAM